MPNHLSEIFANVPSVSSCVIASSIALANFGLFFLNGMPDGLPAPTFAPVRSGNCEFFSRYVEHQAVVERRVETAGREIAQILGRARIRLTSMPGTDFAMSM